MVVLGGSGRAFLSSSDGGGSGGSGSSVSFWGSKNVTVCGLPSSNTSTSPFVSPSMAFPFLSFTVRSTITRLEFMVYLGIVVAGAAGGFCCPIAMSTTTAGIQIFRIKDSEIKAKIARHRSRSGSRRGLPVVARSHHRAEAADIDMVQHIRRAERQLDLFAGLPESPCPVELRVQSEDRDAGDDVATRVAISTDRCGSREGRQIEVRIARRV